MKYGKGTDYKHTYILNSIKIKKRKKKKKKERKKEKKKPSNLGWGQYQICRTTNLWKRQHALF